MPPPVYSITDYALQFQRLLPRGLIWHRGLPFVQDADIATLMPPWARLHLRLNDLLAETFPCTTDELLPEWEASLGLPDACYGVLAPTIAERVAVVCAKFTARGGQTAAYFVAIAEALGYTGTTIQFAPFRCGIDTCGEPLNGEAWAYAWMLVVVPAPQTVIYFRTGVAHCGQPLASWGDRRLECLVAATKPAHTIVIIAYREAP